MILILHLDIRSGPMSLESQLIVPLYPSRPISSAGSRQMEPMNNVDSSQRSSSGHSDLVAHGFKTKIKL